ncbi:MAG: M20/M25/M40 family metallo-hydrolase [Clostridia bacterium]|nr:M20/M25/M40 family metallo-hydrolase [Clostridia bacterium]
MNKLLEIIEALKDEYLSFWEEFCNIESPTDYKEGVDKAGQLVIKKAQSLGFKVEVCEQRVSGNAVCITMNENAQGEAVCFSGHIDTVHPVGSFGYPAVRVDDDYIYGPGVLDCKGGIVAALLAMNALKLSGFKDKKIKLILQSDEETSSKGSNKATVKFMAEKAKNAKAFINCEGARAGGMVLIRKGVLRYRFTVTGKATHASNASAGANAIAEAAYKIIELEQFKDNNGITSNCGIINGGTTENVVPDKCTFNYDFRFMNDEQNAFIKRRVKEIAEKTTVEGTSCSYELLSERAAMEENRKNTELYEKIEEIFEKYGMERMGRTLSGGGSDAADMTSYGIPTVDGLGVMGDGIHSVCEKALISSLTLSAKRLALMAVNL